MANIILRPGWQQSERNVTPEALYQNRRQFLKAMGFLGAAGLMSMAMPACGSEASGSLAGLPRTFPPEAYQSPMPSLAATFTQNDTYTVPERHVTPYDKATRYNNFYEFTTNKEQVARMARALTLDPWSVEITGHVRKPGRVAFEDILKRHPLEERIYRFRCVEAWAMTVPWIGFPLRKLLADVEPTDKARYVRFVTLYRPEEMPAQRTDTWYPWPYYEGLRLDEAMNELTLLTVGMYGKSIPPQNGAPVRLVVPWKYGYKSVKSIVRIELTEEQPPTFWNDLQPKEYGFYSNVNPRVNHPRWSQATERLLTGERVPTQLHNGYAEYVADMYAGGTYF